MKRVYKTMMKCWIKLKYQLARQLNIDAKRAMQNYISFEIKLSSRITIQIMNCQMSFNFTESLETVNNLEERENKMHVTIFFNFYIFKDLQT